VICALKIFFDFFLSSNRKRETRKNGLSHLSRLVFFVARCFLPGELLEEGSTSSTTRVSDDLASVEREERSVRLGAGSVIKTSRKTSSSLPSSGKARGNESRGKEDSSFARGTERKPGRSADSS